MPTLTDKQKAAAFAAVHAYVLERIRAEVPSIFEGKAESALEEPAHRAEVQEMANRGALAAIAAAEA